ncbi:PRC-barrel domain-containing protein [Polymorphobacter sp.]|uniref:PRC-barrel domain-containing protein n=1 Tax=Polymorphobacter sp. TaxID=1909290 RepID=UPI003F72BC57
MIAAVMTASNLGARMTGWGFVVFTLGSLSWIMVGLDSDQSNLVATNIFLTLVNAIGIWRWLGRQARYESVGESAEKAGKSPVVVSVFPATALVGRPILDDGGEKLAEVVEAIIACDTGTIQHVVVRFGGVAGVGEQIVALPLADLTIDSEAIRTRLNQQALTDLPRLDERLWPRLLEPAA